VKTNEFFEEHSTTISIESQEPQLVNFLYNMGMDPAMIRVAKLDLKPADANRYRLKGGITLTANYAKKPATVSVAAAVKPVPGAKPAAVAAPKPPAPAQAQPARHPPGRPAPDANRPAPERQRHPPPNGRKLRPGHGRPNAGNNQ